MLLAFTEQERIAYISLVGLLLGVIGVVIKATLEFRAMKIQNQNDHGRSVAAAKSVVEAFDLMKERMDFTNDRVAFIAEKVAKVDEVDAKLSEHLRQHRDLVASLTARIARQHQTTNAKVEDVGSKVEAVDEHLTKIEEKTA